MKELKNFIYNGLYFLHLPCWSQILQCNLVNFKNWWLKQENKLWRQHQTKGQWHKIHQYSIQNTAVSFLVCRQPLTAKVTNNWIFNRQVPSWKMTKEIVVPWCHVRLTKLPNVLKSGYTYKAQLVWQTASTATKRNCLSFLYLIPCIALLSFSQIVHTKQTLHPRQNLQHFESTASTDDRQ